MNGANMTPEPEPEDEYVTTERVGVIVWRLFGGEAMTTMEIAATAGITGNGAYRMMMRLSRVLPVMMANGKWSIAE
jgi:hypothetical protein